MSRMSKDDGLKVDTTHPYHKPAFDDHTEYWITYTAKTDEGLVFRQRLVYTAAEAKKIRKFLRHPNRKTVKRKTVRVWTRKVKYGKFKKLK